MKAMVIGIDSASPILIEKWKDHLPNLSAIFESGAHGVLHSIVPPESVPAWQCFATGKNPAKIGIYGFTYIGRDAKLRHGRTTPEIGCFWDVCSDRGLKVGVFNVPGTYPAYPVNGFMVCGFPVPTRASWAYPEYLMKRLDRAVGGYEIDVPVTNPSNLKGGEEAYLAQVDRLHRKCLDSAKALLDWFHPDVFMMTFQGIDLVHHDFWRYMEDQNSPYRNVLLDWYVKMDLAVQELRNFTTPDTNVLLLSDHGSAPASAALFINEYLAEHGLLKARNHVKQGGETFTKLRSWLLRNLSPDTIAKVYKISPNFISRRLTLSGSIERTLQNLIDNIDWQATKCFSTGGHQCHFYITDDHDGAQARLEVRQKLCNIMSELAHPATGEKVRPIFHFREDTFKGPFQDEAPDLCVELYTGKEKIQISPRLGTGKLWSLSPHFSSIHTREGFWALAGPKVGKGLRLDASLLDLAPTLLRLLGVETSTDFDGRVLELALDTGHPDQDDTSSRNLAPPKTAFA